MFPCIVMAVEKKKGTEQAREMEMENPMEKSPFYRSLPLSVYAASEKWEEAMQSATLFPVWLRFFRRNQSTGRIAHVTLLILQADLKMDMKL